MMWGYGDEYGWGWGWGMWMAHTFLWWILLILGIVVLVRWIIAGPGHTRGETALDILKKRYARGEIGKEEFEQKKRDLEA